MSCMQSKHCNSCTTSLALPRILYSSEGTQLDNWDSLTPFKCYSIVYSNSIYVKGKGCSPSISVTEDQKSLCFLISLSTVQWGGNVAQWWSTSLIPVKDLAFFYIKEVNVFLTCFFQSVEVKNYFSVFQVFSFRNQ